MIDGRPEFGGPKDPFPCCVTLNFKGVLVGIVDLDIVKLLDVVTCMRFDNLKLEAWIENWSLSRNPKVEIRGLLSSW